MATEILVPDSSVTQKDFVLGVVLHSGFRLRDDGWLYPQGGNPLVRVAVTDSAYQMERRRAPQSAWMRIVEARTDEFDEQAFTDWVENWPLVVQP